MGNRIVVQLCEYGTQSVLIGWLGLLLNTNFELEVRRFQAGETVFAAIAQRATSVAKRCSQLAV